MWQGCDINILKPLKMYNKYKNIDKCVSKSKTEKCKKIVSILNILMNYWNILLWK